jgi:hypothetical protein
MYLCKDPPPPIFFILFFRDPRLEYVNFATPCISVIHVFNFHLQIFRSAFAQIFQGHSPRENPIVPQTESCFYLLKNTYDLRKKHYFPSK